jgi:hypothetical protein
MIDMSIVSVGDIRYKTTLPFTRNKKGLLIQQPYFCVVSDDTEYHFYGRDVMWSFLDALFPDNTLPRNGVEDDLFAPTEHSPSMWSLFTDFALEAFDEGNEYLVFYHKEGRVSMVQSLNEVSLANDIETAGQTMQAITGAESAYAVVKYRDKHGTHLRRIARSYHNSISYEVIDLGTRWYIRVVSEYAEGESVCLVPPRAVKKGEGLRLAIDTIFNKTKSFVAGARDGYIKPLPALSSVLTREYDMLRWARHGGNA